MNKVARKWLLGASLLCLTPLSFALDRDPGKDDGKCKPHDDCYQAVPEGGSAAMYLLAAGLTCLGAVFIRSRSSKPDLS
jgi:hypothetical protein